MSNPYVFFQYSGSVNSGILTAVSEGFGSSQIGKTFVVVYQTADSYYAWRCVVERSGDTYVFRISNSNFYPSGQDINNYEILVEGNFTVLDVDAYTYVYMLKERWADAGTLSGSNSDRKLYISLINSLSQFNCFPPRTTYTFSNIPSCAMGVLSDGAYVFTLIDKGVFEAGKHYSFSDNGLSVTRDRGGAYATWSNPLLTNYINNLKIIKKGFRGLACRPKGVGHPPMFTLAKDQHRPYHIMSQLSNLW
jgi:hypothetical protein